MSQVTSGRLMASHMRVRLEGVWAQPDMGGGRVVVRLRGWVERVMSLVPVGGSRGLSFGGVEFVGDVSALVEDARVVRLEGEEVAVGSAGKSWG